MPEPLELALFEDGRTLFGLRLVNQRPRCGTRLLARLWPRAGRLGADASFFHGLLLFGNGTSRDERLNSGPILCLLLFFRPGVARRHAVRTLPSGDVSFWTVAEHRVSLGTCLLILGDPRRPAIGCAQGCRPDLEERSSGS